VSAEDAEGTAERVVGRVISLDRGFPLVKTASEELRARHSVELVKNADVRAAIGDEVELSFSPKQDTPLITAIHPRGHTLIRRVLVESRHVGSGKHDEQVLATNIDIVFVVCALSGHSVDVPYLERQLVMAHESGAEVVIVLTKADMAKHLTEDVARVRALAFNSTVIVESAVTGEGLARVAALLADGKTGVLLGRSGVGKSTLINELLGAPLLATGAVRTKDRAGRHTTVARKMVFLKQGGALIDTPGLRSVGLYDAHEGLLAAFPDIAAQAAQCRYRDCTHTSEPDCAVLAATSAGTLSPTRLSSYLTIAKEVDS
jgi:ribosome biogenesis GTPase